MLPFNIEQQLGRKSFYVFASRRMTAGFVFFIIGAVLLTIRPVVETVIIGIFGAAHTVASFSLTLIIGSFLISVTLLLVGVIIARVEYRHHTFRLEEFNITFKKGVMSTEETSLPYRQIQSVSIVRGLTHQFSGTSKLVLIIAGDENTDQGTGGRTNKNTDVIFDPIDKDVAEALRETLESKIGVQIVQGMVQKDTGMLK